MKLRIRIRVIIRIILRIRIDVKIQIKIQYCQYNKSKINLSTNTEYKSQTLYSEKKKNQKNVNKIK